MAGLRFRIVSVPPCPTSASERLSWVNANTGRVVVVSCPAHAPYTTGTLFAVVTSRWTVADAAPPAPSVMASDKSVPLICPTGTSRRTGKNRSAASPAPTLDALPDRVRVPDAASYIPGPDSVPWAGSDRTTAVSVCVVLPSDRPNPANGDACAVSSTPCAGTIPVSTGGTLNTVTAIASAAVEL